MGFPVQGAGWMKRELAEFKGKRGLAALPSFQEVMQADSISDNVTGGHEILPHSQCIFLR